MFVKWKEKTSLALGILSLHFKRDVFIGNKAIAKIMDGTNHPIVKAASSGI